MVTFYILKVLLKTKDRSIAEALSRAVTKWGMENRPHPTEYEYKWIEEEKNEDE